MSPLFDSFMEFAYEREEEEKQSSWRELEVGGGFFL